MVEPIGVKFTSSHIRWKASGWVGGWVGERRYLNHTLALRDMGKKPQLQLPIISHNQTLPWLGDKGLANLVLVLERWVGGWVGGLWEGRGDRGGLNALLEGEGEGGWVGGWLGLLYLFECRLVLEVGAAGGKTTRFRVEIETVGGGWVGGWVGG